MAEQKAIARAIGDYVRTVSIEDGNVFRSEHQELGPAMRRAQLLEQANRAEGGGLMGRRYIGSVPQVVLTDWLKSKGYTFDQWARNEGGSRCPRGMDPVAHATLDGGVRSEFLRYFLSRDFSKLHTQHTTTRREMSSIVVPSKLKGDDDEQLRRTPIVPSGKTEPGRSDRSNPDLRPAS